MNTPKDDKEEPKKAANKGKPSLEEFETKEEEEKPPPPKPVKVDMQSEPRGKIYEDISKTIGGTPIVKLRKLSSEHGLETPLLAKLEFFNPLASVKDRAVMAMFESAENAGDITAGKTVIIEPTSGNTGASLAFIASLKGYRLILTLPESMPLERQRVLKHYGAELVLTPSDQGMKGAVEKSKQLLEEEHPEDGYSFNQFENQACVQAHVQTTAKEIWEDTGGNIDILVAGVGTGATITGTASVLKKSKDGLKVYAVEPEESAVLSEEEPTQHQIEGLGVGFVPPLLDQKLLDGVIKVSSDKAFEMAKHVSKTDGIPCGISSGAALAAGIEVAKMPENKGKSIVVILPSYAERYIATPLFQNQDE